MLTMYAVIKVILFLLVILATVASGHAVYEGVKLLLTDKSQSTKIAFEFGRAVATGLGAIVIAIAQVPWATSF